MCEPLIKIEFPQNVDPGPTNISLNKKPEKILPKANMNKEKPIDSGNLGIF